MGFWARAIFKQKGVGILGKVTWRDVLDDFKKRHPTLAKLVTDYRPHSYGTIIILFTDGKTMTYDYDAKKGTWIEDWK